MRIMINPLMATLLFGLTWHPYHKQGHKSRLAFSVSATENEAQNKQAFIRLRSAQHYVWKLDLPIVFMFRADTYRPHNDEVSCSLCLELSPIGINACLELRAICVSSKHEHKGYVSASDITLNRFEPDKSSDQRSGVKFTIRGILPPVHDKRKKRGKVIL